MRLKAEYRRRLVCLHHIIECVLEGKCQPYCLGPALFSVFVLCWNPNKNLKK